MKLVFAGTPQAAVPSLTALAGSGHDIGLVITRADAPLGRKRVRTPSPVAAAADALGLPVVKANRLGDDATDAVAAEHADLGVIVAYGGLVREPLLSTPRLGWINLHFSLLPRWRGAAPVQHALIAGDAVTGAAVFQLVQDLDAGPVFGAVEQPVGDATAGDLLETLSHRGADLLLRVVDELAAGTAHSVPQDGEVTLAPKLGQDDARIDWTFPGDRVLGRIRGVTPEPGAFTGVGDGRLKIAAATPAADAAALPPGRIRLVDGRVLAGTGTHPLELGVVQPAGKKPMPAADWWRGVGADEVTAS